MAKPKKRADQFKTEELAKRLFPKEAIKELKKIAKKKEKPKENSGK